MASFQSSVIVKQFKRCTTEPDATVKRETARLTKWVKRFVAYDRNNCNMLFFSTGEEKGSRTKVDEQEQQHLKPAHDGK